MHKRAAHWEDIYENKKPHQVSWTQKRPTTSLQLILENSSPSDAILDVGGGDSQLVDHLLNAGYTDLSVLDISKNALERAKKRLGDSADLVKWIHTDIMDFQADRTYALLHDRAAFHFLTKQEEMHAYAALCEQCVDHALIIATFSEKGPLKCSGLEINQHNEQTISTLFSRQFILKAAFTEDHVTPFDTTQNFQYSVLTKR